MIDLAVKGAVAQAADESTQDPDGTDVLEGIGILSDLRLGGPGIGGAALFVS